MTDTNMNPPSHVSHQPSRNHQSSLNKLIAVWLEVITEEVKSKKAIENVEIRILATFHEDARSRGEL